MGELERASIEHRAKLAWHLDIVADPSAHAWALALYRAGENHPDTVTDYFPHTLVRPHWPWLADQLKRHAGDERRHAALYTRVIDRMGAPLPELEEADVFNHAIRAFTPIDWAIREEDSREAMRTKVAHFLAHAHHLERRVMRSLDYHVEACARLGRTEVLAVVERVHADEERHVRTTYEALSELTTPSERRGIEGLHVRGEALADRAFSARQTPRFLAHLGTRIPASRRLGYALMALAREHGLV